MGRCFARDTYINTIPFGNKRIGSISVVPHQVILANGTITKLADGYGFGRAIGARIDHNIFLLSRADPIYTSDGTKKPASP